jgi:hypothetical protein
VDIGSSWKVYCEPFDRFIMFVFPVFHQVFMFPVAIAIHIHPEFTNPELQGDPLVQITSPVHPHETQLHPMLLNHTLQLLRQTPH